MTWRVIVYYPDRKLISNHKSLTSVYQWLGGDDFMKEVERITIERSVAPTSDN